MTTQCKLLVLAFFFFAIRRTAHAAPTVAECLNANELSIKAAEKLALREAQKELAICASVECPPEVSAECGRRLREVAASLPSIVFAAKGANGEDLADVHVEMDGQPLSSTLGAAALSIDPGTHQFVFSAPDHESVSKTLIVRQGEKERREVITFAPLTSHLVSPEVVAKHNTTWRTAGGVLAGVGVAGLVAGSIFGGMAASAFASQQNDCRTTPACIDRQQALSAHDTAVTMATASTIAFIAGAVLVVTGGAVFFAAPVVAPNRVVGFSVGAVF